MFCLVMTVGIQTDWPHAKRKADRVTQLCTQDGLSSHGRSLPDDFDGFKANLQPIYSDLPCFRAMDRLKTP